MLRKSLIHSILHSLTSFVDTSSQEEQQPNRERKPLERDITNQLTLKMSSPGFDTRITVSLISQSADDTEAIKQQLISVFHQFSNPPYNGFTYDENTAWELNKIVLPTMNFQIFNTKEISSLWHFPIDIQNMYSKSKLLLPPKNLPIQQGILFGYTNYRGRRYVFGIKPEDKLRHLYILGKSGTGKSTIIKNLVIGEILSKRGLAVIDPHGDLVEDLLNYIPKERVYDVIYVNPTNPQHVVGFNPVHLKPQEKDKRDVLADAILAIFKRYFKSWGPRLEYILYNSILAVLESQGTTLLSIQKMLSDKHYRKRVLSHIKDPGILYFWRNEFAKMEQNQKFITEALSAIQNKIGRFLAPKIIRNILGQTKSTIDLSKIMREQKILLVNLSKGKIGEENASILGSLLITRLYTTALGQANLPYKDRVSFSLYIDEVQSFTTDVFPHILSEARKYKLSLTIAHQFLHQLDLSIINAIFGNVGNMVILNIGNQDAQTLEREFNPYLKAQDFINLRKYQMYVKMVIDGDPSPPFSAYSLPVIYRKFNLARQIIEHSQKKYTVAAHTIEEKLSKWLTS